MIKERLIKIKGMYDQLEQISPWSPMDKAAIAQSMLDEFLKLAEEQQAQITILRSRLDAIQHGRIGHNGGPPLED